MEKRIAVDYKGKKITAEWEEVSGGYRGKYCVDDNPTDEPHFAPGPADWKIVDEVFDHPVGARINALDVARDEIDSAG